ncbi:MAG: hypothetical protein Q8878_05215, partial [Bacillota bacterium]|nr:hypothetical protein [Bacillota bacterium]
DSEGKISLVSVESADMSGTAYVFGTTSVAALPANSKVIKNGNPASAADVKQYDIVTYSNGTYYVSDKKLTGIFQKASPSFTHPSSVTVLGKEFSVTKEAAKYFSGVSYNDLVTLLFDPNMNVAAVYPAQKLQFEQIGILSSLNDSGAKVTLMSGINVELPVELSAYDYTRFNGASVPTIYKLEGKLVKVLQDRNGKMILLASETKQYVSGDWNISAGTLGAAKVLSGVRVFEQVDPSAPIIEVSASDIHIPVVKSDNIRRIFTDYAGRVTHIILGDVTGNGYEYGIFAAGNDSSGNTVTLQQSGGTKSYYSEKNGGNIGTPGEVAKGMENMKCYTNLPCKLLKFMGTVTLGDFDGAKGVTVSDGYIKLSDDVQVYSSEQKKFLTLSEAKANFTSFGIYSDRGLSEGGKVRIILVK